MIITKTRQNWIIALLMIFPWLHSISQSQVHCGNIEALEYIKKYAPEEFRGIQEAFSMIRSKANFRSPDTYFIPVVFHIVYKNQAQNLPDSVIHRQLEILNECFAAKNSDKNSIRSIFGIKAEDANIQFYLADKDPSGNPSTGIIRKSTTKTFSTSLLIGTLNIDMKDNAKGGSSPWDVNKYMNVWIVNMPLIFFGAEQIGVIGFATPPANLPNWPSEALNGIGADGIVIQYQFIGDNNPQHALLGTQYDIADRGRALVHETGHYLGLRHIWADKGNPLFGTPSCTNANGAREDDGIDDTPYCGNSSQMDGCDDFKNTCTDFTNDKPDMWENFMDYSEERCQVLFTGEQIRFMRSTLESFRKNLINISTDLSEKKISNSEPFISRIISNENILIEINNINNFDKFSIININGQAQDAIYNMFQDQLIIKIKDSMSGLFFIRLSNNNCESITLKCYIPSY